VRYYKKAPQTAYTPQAGRLTEKIEACLGVGPDQAKTAQEISDDSGVPLRRVQQHLNYWVHDGRLEAVP
jgi:hypothetical protein